MEEHQGIIEVYLRLGMHDGVINTSCVLCKSKPEMTDDIPLGRFGVKYRLDGGIEEYEKFAKEVEKSPLMTQLMDLRKASKALETTVSSFRYALLQCEMAWPLKIAKKPSYFT